MRLFVLLACLLAAACGASVPSVPSAHFAADEQSDAAIVHPETNSLTCAQCHTGVRRSLNGS